MPHAREKRDFVHLQERGGRLKRKREMGTTWLKRERERAKFVHIKKEFKRWV